MMRFRLAAAILFVSTLASAQAKTGSIAGTLHFQDGKPATGIRVSAMTAPASDTAPLMGIGEADMDGRFRLDNIPPGAYYIVAGRVDQPTFFPGTVTLDGAAIITVTAGETVRDLSFAVTPRSIPIAVAYDPTGVAQAPQASALRPAREVSGRVLSETGAPFLNLPNGSAVVADAGGRPVRAPIRATGDFRMSLVSRVEYRISVDLPDGYSAKAIAAGSKNLAVEPLEVDADGPEVTLEVTLNTPRFRKIRGQISDGANRAPVEASVDLLDAYGERMRTTTAADGSFEFVVATAGRFTVRVIAPFYGTGLETIEVEEKDVAIDLNLQKL